MQESVSEEMKSILKAQGFGLSEKALDEESVDVQGRLINSTTWAQELKDERAAFGFSGGVYEGASEAADARQEELIKEGLDAGLIEGDELSVLLSKVHSKANVPYEKQQKFYVALFESPYDSNTPAKVLGVYSNRFKAEARCYREVKNLGYEHPTNVVEVVLDYDDDLSNEEKD